MCDPVDSILFDSETYRDLHYSIIETPFDGLEQFQLYTSRVIDHQDDVRWVPQPTSDTQQYVVAIQ